MEIIVNMKRLYCGDIHQDDVMSWCIENKKFQQQDQFNLGYNWSIGKNIVYTNNDHFFNGVRISILENKIRLIDIDIIYKAIDGDLKYDLIIDINNQGKISYWPDGFFDTWEKSLMMLLPV